MTKRRKADAHDETADEAMGRLRREIRTDGARDAVRALRAVCNNPNAPANAQATAGAALLRAGGFYEKSEDDGGKAGHEMDGFELQRAAERIVAASKQHEVSPLGDDAAADDAGDGEGDVFD